MDRIYKCLWIDDNPVNDQMESLLTALNEKIFRRGKEFKLPALMFVGASNVLPEDEALSSLFDSFPVRVKSDNVDPDLLDVVLIAG